MTGFSQGKLEVYVRTRPDFNDPQWDRRGSQSGGWLKAKVDISSSVDYQVSVE